ncbi:MAG: hypothetical protein U9Q40_03020 [Campylobacterota bacterium]|nr:hypothetical protein [Campylobacterota bacterium]
MKRVSKLFILIAFFISSVVANDFRDIKEISLKKDEQKKILVKYGSSEKLFKFRWTLYKNGGLVIHRSYNQQVAQNILYERHKNRSFKLELKSRGADFYTVPYILVQFQEFDYEKNEAKFRLMLSDEKMQIELTDI